jgi:GDPmannose 4,6-dehydratase
MWRMLQQEQPDDYVVGTGETHSVREFCELAFREIGVELVWEGSGVEERGVDRATGRTLVVVDPRYFRPAEVELLQADPRKAREKLGWQPRVSFSELVQLMVQADRQALAHSQRR